MTEYLERFLVKMRIAGATPIKPHLLNCGLFAAAGYLTKTDKKTGMAHSLHEGPKTPTQPYDIYTFTSKPKKAIYSEILGASFNRAKPRPENLRQTLMKTQMKGSSPRKESKGKAKRKPTK